MRILDIVTDFDNHTLDTGRSLAVWAILSLSLLEAWNVIILKQAFNAQTYGVGIAAVVASLGVAIFGDSKGKQVQPEVTNVPPKS